MTPFKTVVVATDFSETAEDALSTALEIVGGTRRRLELLNVVFDPLNQPWMIEAAGIDFEALQRAWVDGAKGQFRALLKHRQLDPSMVATHIVVGRPDIEIVRFAEERGADHVVRQATCPVLVVPHSASRAETIAVAAERQGESAAESSGAR